MILSTYYIILNLKRKIMNRKEAIHRIALLLGGTLISPQIFLTSCHGNSQIDDDETTINLFNEIAGIVIPKTDTPSAKEINIAPVALSILKDCYSNDLQKLFKDGLDTINQMANEIYGNNFVQISGANQKTLTKKIAEEERVHNDSITPHYFKLMKELILLTYFTSEIGATQALRYVAVPGKYIGDYPYKKGDKAWAIT